MEELADEIDEFAQWKDIAGSKKRRATDFDLLRAADILREVAHAPLDAENRLKKQRELIDRLRISLSPHEKQQLLRAAVVEEIPKILRIGRFRPLCDGQR
jgi:hypothetical protein